MGVNESIIQKDKSRISAPQQGSFANVAHIGYLAENGRTSTEVDPSFLTLTTQLCDMGVDESILQNKDSQKFMSEFVRTYQSESTPSSSTANGTRAAAAAKKPPPPVPRYKGSKQPPPLPSRKTSPLPASPLAPPQSSSPEDEDVGYYDYCHTPV